MAKEKDLGAMPTGAWDLLQRAVDRFESAWEKGSPPRIEDFLPADVGQRLAVLNELVLVDLERRFKAGQMVQVEVYLKRFPELAPQAVELIAAEFDHQRRRVPAVSVEEYLQRFPQYREQLRGRLSAADPEGTVAYHVPESAPAVTQICANAAPAAAPPVPAGKISSSADLVKVLIGGNFLRPVHQDKLTRDLQHRFPDASALAGQLVRLGWLTEYQAKLILQGKAHELLFGSYILLEPVGKGGMGEVYKARHRLMKRVAALKMVRGDWLADRETVRRFMREVEVAARLSHPNIVAAYESSEVNGVLFLAMEFVEGIDLGRLLKQQGKLPAAEACENMRQAAVGLQHGHERGLVHRDIKPSNLMRTTIPAAGKVPEQPLIKILDLGLARLEHDTGDERGQARTRLGALMGTPDYIAPEQAADTHRADIRADIYSLGCTLYHLLSGQVPFPGGTLMDKLDGHGRREARPLEELCPDLPGGLGAVVRKTMAKKPADRYQTPGDVAAALGPFCGMALPVALPAATEILPAAVPVAATASSPFRAIAVSGTETPRMVPIVRTSPQPELLAILPEPLRVSAPPTPQPDLKKHKPRWWVAGVAGVASAIAGLILIWMLSGEKAENGKPLPPPPVRSPLDDLRAETIPPELRAADQPNELVAVLGAPRKTKNPAAYKVGFSKSSRYLWAGYEEELIQWDILDGKPRKTIGAKHASYGMEVSADGSRLFHCGYGNSGFLIDAEEGTVLKSGLTGGDDVAVSCDGRFLLLAIRGQGPWLFDSQADAWEKDFKDAASPLGVAFSFDNKKVAAGSNAGIIQLWDLASKTQTQKFSCFPANCTELCFAPTGSHFFSGNSSGTIDRWDPDRPKEPVRSYEGHKAGVVTIRLTRDGKTMISVGMKEKVIVWDVASGKKLHEWHFAGGSHDIAVAQDGRHLAVGNEDGTVYILRLRGPGEVL